MSEEDAIRLAARALRAAMRRDSASGEGYNIAVITREKFEYIPEEKIAGYLN
jgi:20S proteasome, alpha and beta subunits